MKSDSGSVNKLLKSGGKSFDKGDFSKAVSYYSKAIAVCKARAKDKAFTVLLAESYNGIGHTLRSKGEFSKSKQFQEKALKMYSGLVKNSTKLQPDFALSLHYMADISADVGQIKKSLSYYKEELKIVRNLYSKNNRRFIKNLVYGLNGTAVRLADTKNFDGALALLKESLRAQRGIFKSKNDIRKNYPNLSWTYHIMGIAKFKGGDLNGAISDFRTALHMRRAIAKENSRYIGALKNNLNDLGDAYSKKGSSKEARKCYKEAFGIIKSKTYRRQVIPSRVLKEERQLRAKL